VNQPSPERQETAVAESDFIFDVRRGLGDPLQKRLLPKYFYDDVGSGLFEVITRLPEYGLTRADERIIERYTPEIVAHLDHGSAAAELGSGSGVKTRRILAQMALSGPTEYFPIDISVGALERCQAELARLDSIRVSPLAGSYIEGLTEAVGRTPREVQLLVLFLGSTIGNFDRNHSQRFLCRVRDILRPHDMLLVGTDLVKPVGQLLAAYDDPTGVTAAFNKNLLARINRELGGDFDLTLFEHEARYDEPERRVEIHLRSLRRQCVRIEAADMTVEFDRGETIWTESSHKFTPEEVVEMGARSGFGQVSQWLDEEWPFANTLLRVE
jgi:dimethylhistidine N-methyltransferase